MMGNFFDNLSNSSLRNVPTSLAFSCKFSSMTMSRTVLAITVETGFPPKVLKNSIPFAKFSATSFVQATAATGCPFPRGFPIVTISGTTSCNWNPQKTLPILPQPVCTSSEMQTPPSFLIIS